MLPSVRVVYQKCGQKFGLRTPLDRIRRNLAERGVPRAMSTLVSFIERG